MTSFGRTMAAFTVATSATLVMAGCGGSGVEGTYTDPNGSMMVELKAGDKASMTFMTETKNCTYKVADKKITLNCGGDVLDFTIHDDGSLTGPPGGMMPILKKSEKK